MITTLVVTVIAFGWVFAFGVIVGRGYSPEKQMPALAGLLPQQTQPAPEPPQDILKAEDLTFMTDLKQKPGAPTIPTRMSNSTNATAPVSVDGKPDEKPAAATPKPQQPVALFDYVLQVAAFKNSSQADTLREKLEGAGLRTRMAVEKAPNGKARWYRVQVLLRGTEEDVTGAKDVLVRSGIKDAQVASKKPAGRSR